MLDSGMRMKIDDLIRNLGDSIGLGNLQLDDDGMLNLQVGKDTRICLELEEGGNFCQVYSSLGKLPQGSEARSAVCEATLRGNAFGRGTNGGAFFIDNERDELLLGRAFAVEKTDHHELKSLLEGMIEAAREWQKKLSEIGGEKVAMEDTSSAVDDAIRVLDMRA